jgi:fructose-bisphosphate aldolase class I
MDLQKLNEIAVRMVEPGRGILAADESSGTIKKRFDVIGVESTEENRRDYRELLFRSDAMREHISGVILFDETIWQNAADGTPLVDLITAAGSIPGIKVDKGASKMAGFPGETVTKGLDGLSGRMRNYYERGARFAKWRAVIDIADGIPTWGAIKSNAHALARYAAICQQNQVVPIVEPEVLMDGAHDIDRCDEVTRWILQTTFQELYEQRVALEGHRAEAEHGRPGQEVADPSSRPAGGRAHHRRPQGDRALGGARHRLPLGGQSDEEATAHLDAMNKIGGFPWKMTFSLRPRPPGRAAEGLVRPA